MKSTERERLAWAAGLFDGEGHIGCRDRTGRTHLVRYKTPRTLVITISQHHRGVLQRFQKAVGLGTIYTVHRKRPSGEPYTSYSWRTGKFEYVQAIVAMLWPWLGTVKRTQATRALLLYREIGYYMDQDRESDGSQENS